MRSSHLLTAVLTLSSFSAAFSWPDSLGDVKALQGIGETFHKRQNNNNNNNNNNNDENPPPEEDASPTPTNGGDEGDSPPESSSGPRETGDQPAESSDPENTDEPAETDGPRETGRPSGSRSNAPTRTTGKPRSTNFDPRLPAGGISMQTPASNAGPFLYKIGDFVTFGWNYTSLSVTPSNIDILATCSENQATYTIAVNQSAEETAVTWDTGAYMATGKPALLTEKYTLIIYDAQSSISATPKAGYLGVFNQFVFSMYSGQPYVDRGDWQCSGCTSGALSQAERQSLMVLATTATITVLSFTWFASGFGLF